MLTLPGLLFTNVSTIFHVEIAMLIVTVETQRLEASHKTSDNEGSWAPNK
jgi:hypothetical protein